MNCPNCGANVEEMLMEDIDVIEDAKSDGIHVCECCEEIDVSSIIDNVAKMYDQLMN